MKYAIHYYNSRGDDQSVYVEYVPNKRKLPKTEKWLRDDLGMSIVGIYVCIEFKLDGAKI